MTDNYDIKLRVDTSDLQLAAQQAQMLSLSTAYNAAGSLSPLSGLAQQSYYSSQIAPQGFMQASSAGLGGVPLMSPFQRQGYQGYSPPYGTQPGMPTGSSFNRTISDTIRDAATGYGNWALRSAMQTGPGQMLGQYFPSMSTLGLLGGGPLDMPVYRSQQMFAERMGENLEGLKTFGMKAGLGAAVGAGAIGSFALPLAAGTPLGLAAFAAGQTADYAFKTREQYMETGRYYNDAMGSVMRDRLGGGASGEQRADFVRGFSKQVGRDRTFTQDDYDRILQVGSELGFMQSANTPEKALTAIDNISKSLKTMYAVGIKIKETNESLEQMHTLGIDVAGSTRKSAQFMGTMGYNAFSANMTTGQMLQAVGPAGGLFAAQGIAPNIGALIHSQNLGYAGEGIRSGTFGIADQAYFGGKEGMANSMTQAMATMNRTPFGQLLTMNMARNKGFAQSMGKGDMSLDRMLAGGGADISAEDYMTMQYRMPELTKDMDPNAMGMGQVAAYLNSVKESMGGGQLNPGVAYQALTRLGLSPDQSRLILRNAEGATKIAGAEMESIQNKTTQLMIEKMRPNNFLSNPKLWFQNKVEQLFHPALGEWAAKGTEDIGKMEHTWFNRLVGDIVHPELKQTTFVEKNLKGVDGAMNLMKMMRDEGAEGVSGAAASDFEKDVKQRTRQVVRDQLENETQYKFTTTQTDLTSKDISYEAVGYQNTYLGKEAQKMVSGRQKRYDDLFTGLEFTPGEYGGRFKMKSGTDRPNVPSVTEAEVNRITAKIDKGEDLTPEEDSKLVAASQRPGGLTERQGRSINRLRFGAKATESEIDAITDIAGKQTNLVNIFSQESAPEMTKEINKKFAQKDSQFARKMGDSVALAIESPTAKTEDIVLITAKQVLGDFSLTKADITRMAEHDPKKLELVNAALDQLGQRKDVSPAARNKIKTYKDSLKTVDTDGRSGAMRDIEAKFAGAVKETTFALKQHTGLDIGSLDYRQAGLVRTKFAERYFQTEGGKDKTGDVNERVRAMSNTVSSQIAGNTELEAEWEKIKDSANRGGSPELGGELSKFLQKAESTFSTERQGIIGDDQGLSDLDAELSRANVHSRSAGIHRTGWGKGTDEFYSSIAKSTRTAEKEGRKEGVGKMMLMGEHFDNLEKALGNIGMGGKEFKGVISALKEAKGQGGSDEKVHALLESMQKKTGWLGGVKSEGAGRYSELAKTVDEILEGRKSGKLSEKDASGMIQNVYSGLGLGEEEVKKAQGIVKMGFEKDAKGQFKDTAGGLMSGLMLPALTGNMGTDRIVTGSGTHLDKESQKGLSDSAKSVTASLDIAKSIQGSLQKIPNSLDDFTKKFMESQDGLVKRQTEVFDKLDKTISTFNTSAESMKKTAEYNKVAGNAMVAGQKNQEKK